MPLMLWLSPAFPVGAFAYSHGLEWAVEAGDIHDARSLGGWLVDLLTFGAPRADAILFAAAYRSAEARRLARALRVQRACRRARALGRTAPRDDGAGRRFRHGGARGLGLRAARGASRPRRRSPIRPRSPPPRRAMGWRSRRAFRRSCWRSSPTPSPPWCGSAPIGQTDGQKILAALLPRLRVLAREAAQSSLADLGGCAFRSDIASMRHETQYSRLFRS